MGLGDDRNTLGVMIEIDESYFTIKASNYDHHPQKASFGIKTISKVWMQIPKGILLTTTTIIKKIPEIISQLV